MEIIQEGNLYFNIESSHLYLGGLDKSKSNFTPMFAELRDNLTHVVLRFDVELKSWGNKFELSATANMAFNIYEAISITPDVLNTCVSHGLKYLGKVINATLCQEEPGVIIAPILVETAYQILEPMIYGLNTQGFYQASDD